MASETGSADIPIDENYAPEDDDFARNIDVASFTSTRSLAPSVSSSRWEHGRRYHGYRDGEYYGPNDEKAVLAEKLLHHMCLRTLDDQLYLAPVVNPKKVLDLGTGHGLWAINMGDRFPDAEVIGTDLSLEIFSRDKPSNVTFKVDDYNDEWVDYHGIETFDFIHMRLLFGTLKAPVEFYKQCLRHLQPGGYIEDMELSIKVKHLSPPPPSADGSPDVYDQWTINCLVASEKWGKSFENCELMAGWIKEAGFEDVIERRYKWPIGSWSSDPKLKELGGLGVKNWEFGMENWILALYTRELGWTYEEVQAFLQEIRRAMKDRRYHVYNEVRVVYGRKPS